MQGLFAILILWLIINLLSKGFKAASRAGRQQNQPQRRAPAMPPLTPTVRPGGRGAPDWSEVMTMLNGQQAQKAPTPPAEGESAPAGASGSLTGSSIMDGSQPMMDESGPDYEGQTLPGELSADAVAVLPKASEPATAPMLPAFQPKMYDPEVLRDAVVWAEILAKPKALRRVAR